MPQLVKKRRSGWAVLAAGALVASIFAVGAAPAAAAPIDDTGIAQVSALSGKTSCLGPALDAADFSDVAMGTAHYNAVNCIAHYGITAGRGDGTFGASDNVTRSQMALFLSGMSALAGVTLDDAMDAGFTDLGDTAANRVNAINRLVNGGIMTGSGAGTFSPEAAVTRAEMAMWLVNFMVAATGNDSQFNVEQNRDGTYKISAAMPTTTDPGNRMNVTFDHFPDARLTQPAHVDSAISAAFELGITAGYGDNEFKGHRLVTRAEMASFITRTLAHTNVRPAGLTAQHDGDGGIQVSLRDAMFAPVANEPIDLFRSYFADYAFRSDGSCETRYVNEVTPSHFACEIDSGDTTTEADGNKNYTADELTDPGEGTNVVCGTETFDIAAASESMAVFWAWTGALEDTVDADTDLVKVEGVSTTRRMGGQAPHHANVTGGLDATKNQLEARMGTNVRFMLQLHANPADNRSMMVDAAPDASGNRYNLVVQVNELGGPGSTPDTPVAFSGDGAANTRNAVRVGTDTTYGLGALVSRTPVRVVSPDASGMIPIDVTYSDPDRARDNADVVVSIELTAYQVGSSDTTAANYNPDYNTIDNFMAGSTTINRNAETTATLIDPTTDAAFTAGYALGFETRVIFSDDRLNPYMVDISASAPVYRLTRGTNSPVGSYVDISALDQYGNPVRGLSVNAISNQDGDADEGRSAFPFVQYFTTRSNGTYRVSYSYSGDPVIETLTAFAAIANQAYDHDEDPDTPNALRLPLRDTDGETGDTTVDRVLEQPDETLSGGIWDLLLRGIDNTKSTKKVYWANVGRVPAPDAAYATGTVDEGLLAVDVPNKSFVVNQVARSDPAGDPTGPHVYYWDEHDTFTVAGVAVSMALFEEIASHKDVTVASVTWSSYNYNRPNDRAHWTVTCS